MSATIAVVGCLDTKGDEIRFVKKVIEAEGCRVHVVDTGILPGAEFAADTGRAEVARAGGGTLEDLIANRDRGEAVSVMSDGAARVIQNLYRQRKIQGVLAAGGSANTSIGCAAMRALPIGFPKVMISTLASGNTAPFVDTKDILMLNSVVDVAGVNRISARILANGALAVTAMARASWEDPEDSRPIIAATMFGVTTACVTAARKILEEAGYEVLVFHATGVGGRAMEDLIHDGFVTGVLDITTTELADELVGGVMSAGARRLTVAGRAGIPQVVSIGAVDMVNFGPRDTVPEKFQGRKFYQHNPNVTLMRTTPEENEEIGKRMGRRLRDARGPVQVFLPLRGVSSYSKAGGPFHDPTADTRCIDAIKQGAGPRVKIQLLDTDINDPAFARACAQALLDLLGGPAGARQG